MTGIVLCNVYAKSLWSCLTRRSPINYNPPGSSVHRILQARILEWLASSFSRGSSQPGIRTWVFYVSCIGRQGLYHYHHPGRSLYALEEWIIKPFRQILWCDGGKQTVTSRGYKQKKEEARESLISSQKRPHY